MGRRPDPSRPERFFALLRRSLRQPSDQGARPGRHHLRLVKDEVARGRPPARVRGERTSTFVEPEIYLA